MLWQDEESVAWLNVVPERRDTGYHDHDGSAVGVYVLEGSVTNEGLPVGAPRRARRYGPGDSFHLQRTPGPPDEASPREPAAAGVTHGPLSPRSVVGELLGRPGELQAAAARAGQCFDSQ